VAVTAALATLAVVVLGARLRRLSRLTRRGSVLVVVAALLPRAEAETWLLDLSAQLRDMDAERRRAALVDVVRRAPGLLWAAWGLSLHGVLTAPADVVTRVAVRWVRPRLGRVDAVLRSSVAAWPAHDRQAAHFRARWRALRRWSRVLRRSVRMRAHPELATRAAWLAEVCSRMLAYQETIEVPAESRLPTAGEAALLLEISHTTMQLVQLLHDFPRRHH
jgi:hypothetical protein